MSGIHRVQCIGADGRHPAWHGRRTGWPRQQPGQASGGILSKSHVSDSTKQGSRPPWVIGVGYTPRMSCSVVMQKQATASALCRCLGVGLPVTRVSHDFPKLLSFCVTVVHLSMYGDIMLLALLGFKGTSS
ncbi:hypothetical protein TNCV_3873241 [Trichonephila clavipes]|nr:hypothetical protein TNCV_3873241 [Trichonephila clavipes]